MIVFDSPEHEAEFWRCLAAADADEEVPMYAIKAQPYDKRWTPRMPWWTGYEFSPLLVYAKRFPTREAAEAELPQAIGRTYDNAVVVELDDPESD